MQVWWCLFKKEFRLMRSLILANGLILMTVGLVGAYLAGRYHLGIPSLILFIAMVWHAFYLLVYQFASLKAERHHSPLWLQTPQSAWILLSAKLAAGLVIMCTSLAVSFALWLWVLHLDFQPGSMNQVQDHFRFLLGIADLIRQHGVTVGLVFAQRALFLATLWVLIFFLGDTLKYDLKCWRWILSVLLFVATIFATIRFGETSLYDTLFHWGFLDVSGASVFVSPMPSGNPHFVWNHGNPNPFARPIYAGDLTFGLLLSAIWFTLAGWLLDRKVEV